MEATEREAHSYLESVGNTPLIKLDGIFVKLECANPGGSVKDRIARYMLTEARRRGELCEEDVIVEATSGNTGIALALAAREMGHRLIIFMPEHMTVERRQIMENLGAEVRLTSREGGFEGAIGMRDEFQGVPGFYVPDQFSNPDNIRCHEVTTGEEILKQLEDWGCSRLDYLVAGVGTGGTLMGLGRAVRKRYPRVRIAAVEPEESPVMSGGPPGSHGIMGIGDGFIPDLVDMSFVDEVVCVSTADAHTAATKIRDEHGYCVGRSAGANTLAAQRLSAGRSTVLTLWPDCANRYISVGLHPPSSGKVRCIFRAHCEARSASLLPSEKPGE